MGNPRKTRKTYQGPSHPWQKTRIDEEKRLKDKYYYKNKKELWKVTSKLRNYRRQARRLIPLLGTSQGELEKKQIVDKLSLYGLVTKDAQLDNILKLEIEDILNRRLQTLVYRKGLANTIKQARQFITHGLVKINNNTINSPSYMVKVSEEAGITLESRIEERLKSRQKAELQKEVENVKTEAGNSPSG